MQSAAIETLESRLLLKANPMGGEYRINQYINGQETLSDSAANAIASDHDGNYVVTWTSTGALISDNHDGSFSGVYAQLYEADGTPIGNEFRVNSTTLGHQLDATVGMNDTGAFVIAWTAQDNQDGSLSGVYAQQYAADGSKLGGEFRVNSNTTGLQASPSVAVAADGSFTIVWQDASPSTGAEIRGQTYLSNRAPTQSEFIVNSSPGSTTAGNVSVSAADDGSFVVAWSSSGSNAGVYTRRYTVAGAPAAAEVRVSTNGGGTPVGLDVDSLGNYVVSWLQGPDVFVRKFDSAGVAMGATFQANTPTAPGQFRIRTAPRVGLADSGRVFVTWMEATPLSLGFSNYGIWMREFKPDRSSDGLEFRVNTAPAGNDGTFGPSAVSVDGFGDIRVVWQTDVTGTTGTTNDIHGQNYNRAHRPTDIVLQDYTVDENLPPATVISALGTVDLDPGDTFLYDLVPGAADNAYFSIDPLGNELATADTFDFEGKPSYSILVRVVDSWLYVFTKTITISINDVNESPTLQTTSLTIAENPAQGALVGTIVAQDQDAGQSLTWSITKGNENGAFSINPTNGKLLVANPALINFEVQATYTLDITVMDNGSPRKGVAGKVVVKITNVNEKPTALALVPSAIPENQLVGTMVGTFSTTDPDNGDTFTYSLVAGTGDNDNALFGISGNQLQSATVFDYETKASYKVRVRTTDKLGLTVEKALIVGIINQNEQPTIANASFTVPENSPVDTVVGQLVAGDVDAGSVLTYSITSGNSSGAFAVNALGQVVVANPAALNFEGTANFALVVKVSDSGLPTLSQSANVAIALTDVYETPTAINLSPANVPENEPSGTLIGTLTTTDSDIGETYTYALVSGVGANNNGQVNIVGNQLFTTTTLDRETLSTLKVRVLTTDSHGLAFEQPLTVTVDNVNEAPTALQLSAQAVAENLPGNTPVGTFQTTDPDVGDGFTYSLISGVGGEGNSQFSIVGDQLLTNASFNYEAQNSYSILVRTTDFGGQTFDQTFIITITDVNDAPQLGNALFSVNENSPANLVVGTLTATDADPGTVFTYTLSATGNTGGAFAIDPSTGQLKIANPAAVNFEAKPVFNLTVVVTDNGSPQLSASAAVTVNVGDINEAPTSLGLTQSSVDENLPIDTTVGQFIAVDPDTGNSLTYSLIAGTGDTGNSQFHVVGNQLRTSAAFDRETQTSYSILARVSDQNGLTFDKILTITVNNVNEGPTTFELLPTPTVPEVKPAGYVVGHFATTDIDVGDTFTYTLQPGIGSDDNGIFTIVGDELRTTTVLDFEAVTTYAIRVRTTDANGLSFELPLIVDVINRNEPPTDILLSSVNVPENQVAGTPVGDFSAVDQDLADQFAYSLVPGIGATDNAMFNIVSGQLRTAAPLDFETHNTYFIRVQVTDLDGKSYQRPLTIHVSDLPDAPTDIALSPNSISEDATVNTVVGVLSTTDPDFGDSFTYTLEAGAGADDNAKFQISGQQVTLKAPLDFELKSDYSIRVQSRDAGGLTVQKALVIHVTNANDAPTNLSLSNSSIAENSPQGTQVGVFVPVDSDAGDTFTYSLVSGVDSTDNNQFLISGNKLLALTKFNAETQPTRSIRVRVTDADGLSYEKPLVITVTNVNEAPTAVALSSTTVAENQPIGTVVGNLSTTDVDAGDTFTYTLVSGAGDGDNSSFEIAGEQLVTAAEFDFEGKKVYRIRVRSTDAGGLSVERSLTIEVTSANEAPTSLTLGSNSVGENLAIGTNVGTLHGTDPDQGDVLTYSLVAGAGDTGNEQFQIVDNHLQTAAILDFETHPDYSVRVRVTDSHGATLDQVFILNVENRFEPPVVHLSAGTRAAVRKQTIVLDEQATLVDDDSLTMDGGGLSVAVTGGPTSDALKLRNGSTSEGVAWKVIRGGRAIQVGSQTVATIQGGTKGQPLVINFQTGVSRGLAEAFLRNITFRGTTVGTRTVTIRATDNTSLVSEPATLQVEVS